MYKSNSAPLQYRFKTIEPAWVAHGRLSAHRRRAVAGLGHRLDDSGHIYHYLAQSLDLDVDLVVVVGCLGHDLEFGWYVHCCRCQLHQSAGCQLAAEAVEAAAAAAAAVHEQLVVG